MITNFVPGSWIQTSYRLATLRLARQVGDDKDEIPAFAGMTMADMNSDKYVKPWIPLAKRDGNDNIDPEIIAKQDHAQNDNGGQSIISRDDNE